MNIDGYFEHVTVLGAAGKMGSGISLLLAWEMARLKHQPENRDRTYRLNLIDIRSEGLDNLVGYIRAQSVRQAQKQIEAIRPLYQGHPNIKTDDQMAQRYVEEVLSVIHTSIDFNTGVDVTPPKPLIFEAVPEVESLKLETLRKANGSFSKDALFLSNTSSIPIEFLDRHANLDGRIVGFHFYNPPAVQKLVEFIPAQTTRPELMHIAPAIAQRLGKTLVPSRDIAGFIGNGHFVRDVLHAISAVERLSLRMEWGEAIYAVNKISQTGLLRPMGIFQLVDYVGIEVFVAIMKVMDHHLTGEVFSAPLIDRILAQKQFGGRHDESGSVSTDQTTAGSQKSGFFRYDGNTPVDVYDLGRDMYIPIRPENLERIDRTLGDFADDRLEWKHLKRDEDAERKLKHHFKRLANLNTLGARLTLAYLRMSKCIGEKLVSDGVAESPEDVNTVLMSGFGHLYGPFNDYGISCKGDSHDYIRSRKPAHP